MKYGLILLFVPIVLFISGCQGNKKKSVMRCIYDQSVFREACQKAVADEEKFSAFKSDPFYALLFQGYSCEEGWAFLRSIEKDCPGLISEFDRLRSSDQIGRPKTFDYGHYGAFSPTTLHDIYIAGLIQNKMGARPCKRIVQIGAGYGGLCKILHDLSLWDSYAIVDLPEHLALARKVLERQGISHVAFYSIEEIPSDGEYDWVVSDLGFSAFSRPMQKRFADRILTYAKSGYLLGHLFPRHFGVQPFSPAEIKAYLEKKHKTVRTGGERGDYYLSWNCKE